MPLLAFCHADRDPRPSAGGGANSRNLSANLENYHIYFSFFLLCVCEVGGGLFFYWNTKTGNPELLQLCHASVEKVGGGGGRDVGGKGEGGHGANVFQM